MGRIINKSSLVSNIERMNSELTSMQNAVGECRRSYDCVIAHNDTLAGSAWSQFRNYLYSIQNPILDAMDGWIDLAIVHNNSYVDEANKLSENVMNEDKFKSIRMYYQNELDSEYNKSLINRNYYTIQMCKKMIQKMDNLLSEIVTFDSYTCSLYKDVSTALVPLEKLKANCKKFTFYERIRVFSFEELSSDWIKELYQVSMNGVLAKANMTQEELKAVVDKGVYTEAEVVRNLHCCISKEDIEFYKNLLNEEYVEAFQMDPNNLTEAATIIMADYAHRLYMLDDVEGLTALNGAILISTETLKVWYGSEENGSRSFDYLRNTIFRDVYLERMAIGTMFIQRASLINLATMDPNAEDYKELESVYKSISMMNNLWVSEKSLIDDLESKNGERDNTSYTELDPNNGGCLTWDKEMGCISLTFDYHNYGQGRFPVSVVISALDTSTAYSDCRNLEEIIEMNKKVDSMFKTAFIDVTSSLGMLVIGAAAPEMVFVSSIGYAIVNGSITRVSGIGNNFEDKAVKLALNGALSFSTRIINAGLAYGSAVESIDKANYEAKMNWFGEAGHYHYTDEWYGNVDGCVNIGITDPTVLRTVYEWQEEGIESITGWNQSKREEMISKLGLIYRKSEDKELIELAKHILNDNYNILSDSYIDASGNTVKVDFIDFQDAVMAIDVVSGDQESDLHTMFNQKVRENKK